MSILGSTRSVVLLLVACAAPPLAAQTLGDWRDATRRAAEDTHYAVLLATLGDIAVDGELSGGSLTIEGTPDLALSFLSVPWRDDLELAGTGVRLRCEATLGYSSARLDLADVWAGQLPGFETRVTTRYDAFGVDGGIGPSIPMGAGIHVQPLGHLGLAYVENKTLYSGPGEDITRLLADGILFNWDAVYLSYGGSLAVRRDGLAWGDLIMDPVVRYDVRWTEGLALDDPALDTKGTTQWLTARWDVRGPTGWRLADRDLIWHADLGYRRWLGASGQALGFDDYFELGAALSWHGADFVPVVSGLRLGGALLLANDAFGWSIGVSVDF